jgi:hypothetical protein
MSALPPAIGDRTDLRDKVYQPSTVLKPAFIGIAGPNAAADINEKTFPKRF